MKVRCVHAVMCAMGVSVLSFRTTASAEVGMKAVVQVNVAERGSLVPAGLYGIFMEELSHAFDGGVYAELIQNRSFEEGVLPPGMKLVKKHDGALKMELAKLPDGVPEDKWDMPWPWNMGCGWDTNRALIGWSLRGHDGGKAEMELTDANPMNEASSRSLRLVLNPAEGEHVDLVNSGYWGINVRDATAYRLRFFLRPGTFKGDVAAILEAGDGRQLARHDFGVVRPGDTWQELSAVMEATGSDTGARFALRFRGKGSLQVDWVSLFPPTFKQRPNGLRPDLVKYLEDYRPDFVRYPGGCYAEGHSFEGAPDWRTMVRPPEERPGTWSVWQYRSSDGFGYHEFLQFCEDIGSDAMYVTFAGMTCHPENNWPIKDLDAVIQRTLDAIEYAIGPTDSTWGAVRAKMGHPAPFPLKYVEIGNEHPPAVYGDYYVKFRQAIKARYPDMVVIMTMFWSGLNQGAIDRAGDGNIDIVDEHAYRPSGWIRTNFDYFDKYPRKPWKVYLGEYAHHHANGDWSAAMDDSVFLMAMERNGDLVTMASYAPLFVNVNHRSWGVNLIEFDSSRSFAHASYYVQKTFNANRPEVNVATTFDLEPKPDPNRPLFAGRFGLGAWHTVNEFKEFRIYDKEGALVFSDDFESLDNWDTPGIGDWKCDGGILKQTDTGKGPASLFLKKELKTGRITVKARRTGGNEGFLMFFAADGPQRYMFCNFGAAGNAFSAIQGQPPEGIAINGGGSRDGGIDLERWYDISLVVTKDKAEMFLDGEKISEFSAQYLPAFFAAAGYDGQAKNVVVKATNYNGEPVETRIDLKGIRRVGKTGRHIVICSENPNDENSLDNPGRIVPREVPLPDCTERFSVMLAPYSVNVLRIPVEQ